MSSYALPSQPRKQIYLNRSETNFFWVLETQLLEIKNLRLFESTIARIFAAPLEKVSFNVKLELAKLHYTCAAALEWGYRHFPELELEYLISHQKPSLDNALQLARNENLSWSLLRYVLLDQTVHKTVKEVIVLNLADKILSPEVAANILKLRQTSGITVSTAVKHVRKFYEFDNAIPDEWIEHSMNDGKINELR